MAKSSGKGDSWEEDRLRSNADSGLGTKTSPSNLTSLGDSVALEAGAAGDGIEHRASDEDDLTVTDRISHGVTSGECDKLQDSLPPPVQEEAGREHVVDEIAGADFPVQVLQGPRGELERGERDTSSVEGTDEEKEDDSEDISSLFDETSLNRDFSFSSLEDTTGGEVPSECDEEAPDEDTEDDRSVVKVHTLVEGQPQRISYQRDDLPPVFDGEQVVCVGLVVPSRERRKRKPSIPATNVFLTRGCHTHLRAAARDSKQRCCTIDNEHVYYSLPICGQDPHHTRAELEVVLRAMALRMLEILPQGRDTDIATLVLVILPRVIVKTVVQSLQVVQRGQVRAPLGRGLLELCRLTAQTLLWYPEARTRLDQLVTQFHSTIAGRHKNPCPDIGVMAVLASMATHRNWFDVVGPFMEEFHCRNALWLIKDDPKYGKCSMLNDELIKAVFKRRLLGCQTVAFLVRFCATTFHELLSEQAVQGRDYQLQCNEGRILDNMKEHHHHVKQMKTFDDFFEAVSQNPQQRDILAGHIRDGMERARTMQEYRGPANQPNVQRDTYIHGNQGAAPAGGHTEERPDPFLCSVIFDEDEDCYN